MANRIALLAGVAVFGTASSAWAASCEMLRDAQIPKVTIDSATAVPAGTFQPPGSPVVGQFEFSVTIAHGVP